MKVISVTELGKIFRSLNPSAPRVLVGGNFATPWPLVTVLDSAVESYRLFGMNMQKGTPRRVGVTLETAFVGPGMRHFPGLVYYPMRLSQVPGWLKSDYKPDVVLVQARFGSLALDLERVGERAGMVSLGTEVNILPAAIEACHANGGIVVAEFNNAMPYTYGDGELWPCDIDYAISTDRPMASPPAHAPTYQEQEIATHVASLIHDGSTLQTGIGTVPDEVLALLAHRKNLRVWSELISDGVMRLAQAGAIEPLHPVISTFGFGSQEFYRWLNHNPHVRFWRTEVVNDPAMIAHCKRMVSINSALEVDLHDQANAAYVNGEIYSGFGGQPDFVVGAHHSKDGISIIALPGWRSKLNRSSIVERISGPATSIQHSYVVTEDGIAQLWGKSEREQCEELIRVSGYTPVRKGMAA